MTTDGTLIFGRLLVRRWNRVDTPPIAHGALYAEAGRIVAIGPYEALQRRYPAARRVGDARSIVVPGFVNAHAHGRGLTTWQLGQVDEPLEPRIVEFVYRRAQANGAAAPNAGGDAYLDTLYACAKQVASGITTTVHSHQYMDGPVDAFEAELRPVLDAYRDSGLRCAFTVGIRDRTAFSFADDPDFLASLPPALVPPRAGRCDMSFEQYAALLRTLAAAYPTIAFQLGPWNPVFCSDALLEALADAAHRDGWRIQTHLNETKHQAAYGHRQHGKSWVRRLDAIGLLSERFSGAHGVWLDDGDIEILARAGAQIVYNPSSNLRLRSGLAPVHALLRGGVKVAFGLDSLSLNDDDDILQDLRLGQLIQNGWGIDGDAIPAEAMLEMATATGATVAGIGGIGALSEGGRADAVLLSLGDIEGSPSDHAMSGHAASEAILKRGRAAHVRTVVIGGKVLIEDGRWVGRGPAELLAALTGAGAAGPRDPEPQLLALKEAVRGYLRCHDA